MKYTYPGAIDEKRTVRFEITAALIYFVIFTLSIIFYETVLRFVMYGGVNKRNMLYIAFAPAEGMFFASLSGFHRKHSRINYFVSGLWLVLLGVYYGTQLVYYRIFGSVLSVSLLGMGGEAIGNFGWAMKDTIIASLGVIAVLWIPFILFILFSNIGRLKEATGERVGAGYRFWLHLICMALTAVLWGGAVLGIKAAGTDRQSAYYVLKDPLSDSDTTAERVGVLTTSVVEAAGRYLGIGSGEKSITVASVDNASLNVKKNDEDKNQNKGESGLSNSGAGSIATVADEIMEEPFISVPYKNDAIDFVRLAENAANKDVKELAEYFASREGTGTNEYTGMFEGYNLIYICAESFSSYALDPNITPLLYKMANEGIVLENYYNSFKNTTTNGEYAFATSLWPDTSRIADNGAAVGSFPQSANIYMPYGLGDFFEAEGVPAYAYHNFWGAYYKRRYSWPNLGYTNLKFMGNGMNFSTEWPASDLEMFEQSVDDYIEKERFHAYYMTFSGHGPYSSANCMYGKNIDAVKALAGDTCTNDEALAYFCGEYELEIGLQYLVDRLEEAGKLDKTVIVIAGDHYPYYLSNSTYTYFTGEDMKDSDFTMYHSSCIIYNAGMEEPIVSKEYCCNVDILPTVLNLFGIDFDSRLLMGTDIFSDGIHRARLYNGSFLTDYVWYNSRTGETIWQDAAQNYSQDTMKAYFNAMIDYTENEYSASLKLLAENFYLYVWHESGLIDDEAYRQELTREEKGRETYEYEAQKQAEEEALKAQEEQQLLEQQMLEQGLNPDGTLIDQF